MSKVKAVLLDTSVFRRAYIVCLFLCNVAFIQIAAYAGFVLLFLWGVFLVFYDASVKKTVMKTRYALWLLAFLFVTMITALIHITENFVYNFFMELLFCIYFFIFYAVHTEKELNFRRELYSVCRFIVYFTTVVGIIGLAFLMSGISFEVYWIKFIVYENRFTGFYTNPNVLGFTAVSAIFSCHMLLKKDFIAISGKDRVSNIWIGSCVAVNAISLLLCDSNGALVLMIGYVIFFLFYKMFGAERKFTLRQIVSKALACLLLGVFIIGTVFFVRMMCQKGFTDVMDAAEMLSETEVPGEHEEEESDLFSATTRITFSHLNKNIDSGRLTLLRQAASLFKDNPVFGIGKGNVYGYGELKFDNGIKFSDIYGEWLAIFVTDFHNGYAMILVCAGMLGFVIFSIFGLRFAKHISVHVFRRDDLKESILPCMYAFLCAYLVYALFEKALLYDISFTVGFFWMIMGYVSCFLEKYEPDDRSFYVMGKRLQRTII